MTNKSEFQSVFDQLRLILKAYEDDLVVHTGRQAGYVLNTKFTQAYKKDLLFGSVKICKSYVSFQLMPVYMFPELLKEITPRLRARMQGKSCFNFRSIEPSQLNELTQLCKKSFARFKKEKLLG